MTVQTYFLQALQFVDQLKESWSGQSEDVIDDSELLAVLHAVLGLTISTEGQEAVVNVLSFDLEPLLSLITPTGLYASIHSRVRLFRIADL